jgi:hypothetical protein
MRKGMVVVQMPKPEAYADIGIWHVLIRKQNSGYLFVLADL